MAYRCGFWVRFCLPLALSVLATMLPAKGRADVVVLVPPHAEAGIQSDVVERAVEALTRSLRVDGFDVVSSGQAAAVAQADAQFEEQYGDQLERCVTPQCAFEFRRLFDANFAVQTALFRNARGLSSMKVVIVEQAEAYFTGAAEVEGGDIEGAMRAAYKRARERQAEGVGPWLSVDGLPANASVYVDGLEFGHVPITRRRLGVGTHRVEVRADGYASEARNVEIPDRPDHEEKLVVQLPSLSSGRKRHVADWVVGGLLTAGGLVYVASGVRDFLVAGDCVDRDAGFCIEERTTNTTSKLKLGLGAGAAALGIFTMAYGPIGVMTSGDRTSASLRVRYQF